MKRIFILVLLSLAITVGVQAQSTDCPPNLPQTVVCVSREAYIRLLRADDERAGQAELLKAKDAQIAARDKQIDTITEAKNDIAVKYAQVLGENTELRASRVRDAALMDILIKNARPKKVGFINLF